MNKEPHLEVSEVFVALFKERVVRLKDEKVVSLRPIHVYEAEALLKAIYEISLTSDYILTTPAVFKTITVEQEEKWIERYNVNPRAVLIGADHNGQLVGLLDFAPYKDEKRRHRGVLGISIHHDFRGKGLGQELFKFLFALVKQDAELESIELAVMSTNVSAIELYKKMGFVELCRLQKAFIYKGVVSDEITMRISKTQI